MSQGALSFQYQVKKNFLGMTSYAGLAPYLDLMLTTGMLTQLHQQLQVKVGEQGWTDEQMTAIPAYKKIPRQL